MRGFTFIPAETKYRFIKLRWFGFALSVLAILGTIFVLSTRGLNLGIDFAGGILMEVRTEETADLAAFRSALAVPELGEVSLQTFGDDREVLIRVELSDEVEQAEQVIKVRALLDEAFPKLEYRKVDYVGPTVGQELIESGTMALLIALGGILLYVWFRFEWQFGMGAVVALVHDAFLILGFYAVSGFDFGLTSIAAMLTVIGYSINDSVVIYDRIRENMRKYKKKPMEEILDLSINNTLSRTVITALTTLLAAGALTWLGGEVIRGFSAALVFGVAVGTYSSIFVAAPVLLYFQIRREDDEADADRS